MNVFLNFEHFVGALHLHTESHIEVLLFLGSCLVVLAVNGETRVVGVFHPLSGVGVIFCFVDVSLHIIIVKVFYTPILAGEIHHGSKPLLFR